MVKFSFAYLVKNEELYSRKLNKKPSKNNGNMKAAIIDKIGKMMAEAMKEAICENEQTPTSTTAQATSTSQWR